LIITSYLTTITKHVLQIVQIILVSNDGRS